MTVLNCRHIQKISGRKRRTVLKKDEMFYVPLLLTLEKILKNDYVLKITMMVQHLNSILFLFRYFRSSNNFYYDDLEICNPLGSRHKIHKVGLYTFTCAFSC